MRENECFPKRSRVKKKRNLKVKRLFAKVVRRRAKEGKKYVPYVKWNGKGFVETPENRRC